MSDAEKIPEAVHPPYDPKRVYDVPLEDIWASSEFNVRGFIDPTDVMELSRDIRSAGTLLQPVVIQPFEDNPKYKFRMLAGHRRHKAYQLLGWKVIPALIKEGINQAEAWAINMRENIQRQNLNVLQEARGIEHLKDMEIGQPEIARLIGKSRGWVQERVYLLEMPEDIQAEAAAGNIALKDVRHAWSLQSTQQQREYIKSLKEAKILKKTKMPNLTKFRRTNEKRLRTKQEIEEMQDIIRETFGNGIATRAMGWSIGYNSDAEMHEFLAHQARLIGKFYAIPGGFPEKADVTPVADDAVIPNPPPSLLDGEIPDDDSDIDQLIAEAKNA